MFKFIFLSHLSFDATYSANAWIEHHGNPGYLEPHAGWVWQGTRPTSTKLKEFWVWDLLPYPEVELHYYSDETQDADGDTETYWENDKKCKWDGPLDWQSQSKLSDNGDQKDYDECGAYCDEYEQYGCD